MRESNIAPFFVCAYAGLATIARDRGYALAIHGSVVTDMDLVAVPWTETAVSAEELVEAIRSHMEALHYRDLLRQ